MKRTISLLLMSAFLFPAASLAQGDSLTIAGKRAKIVGKAALYGAGGGLVVGVASQVFKKKAKNIFLFGSLGMYAGILTGIYVISTTRAAKPYEGPDTYEDYGDFSRRLISPEAVHALDKGESPFEKDAVSMRLVSLEF